MQSISLAALIFTLTSLANSGSALPTLDQPSSTRAATTNVTHNSNTYERPSTIDADISTNNQVSIFKQPEEPTPAILLVQSLPFAHNITLPVSTCLDVYENPELGIVAQPICPDDQKPYTLLFGGSQCTSINPLIIESYMHPAKGIWLYEQDSGVALERWSLMFKCARSKSEALQSLYGPKGMHALYTDRTRTMIFPIINDNEVGLVLDYPHYGILAPIVNKESEATCLWSSSPEFANKIRLIRPLKCPKRQKSYAHLYTQRECRGKFALSDGHGVNTTFFDFAKDLEEWSILFTCSDFDNGVGGRDPVIGKVSELKIWNEEEELASLQTPHPDIANTTTHQISADPHNATLALTHTTIPQIFHVPLSTCLSSTLATHKLSPLLHVVTPPTCPPERPRLATVLYVERGCTGIGRRIPTAPSYPDYKLLFDWPTTRQVRAWSLGFFCHPEGPVILEEWRMTMNLDLVIEEKGASDAVVKVVQVEPLPKSVSKPKPRLYEPVWDPRYKPETGTEVKGGEETAQNVRPESKASSTQTSQPESKASMDELKKRRRNSAKSIIAARNVLIFPEV